MVDLDHETDKMSSDVKLPILQWGQDPMFNTFNRMYIGDIVSMKEYETAKSDPADDSRATPTVAVFDYNGHPVWKVDVLGVVIRVEQKDRLINYSIDDGTGVLNCTHWKKHKIDHLNSAHLSSSLQSLHKKLSQLREQKQEGFCLGDLVHVRGRLKRFRGNVEITASYLVRVESANMEIVRMMTLPDLYRNCYDKPATVQSTAAKLDQQINETKKRILDFLSTCAVPQMSMAHLENKCKLPAPQELPDGCSVPDSWNAAVQLVVQDGHIYPTEGLRTHFRVVIFDTDLFTRIKEILHTEARKAKYRDKGCYYLRVLEVLKLSRQYSQLSGAVILRVLGQLEANSEIFSPEYKHYLVMDY